MKKFYILLVLVLLLSHSVRASLYRNYYTEDGLSHNCVWAVLQDHRGYMWFGTNDGLNRFDGLKFKVYRRVEGDTLSLGNNFIHCLVESPDGKMLVGTKGGLYSFSPETDDFRHIPLDGKVFGHDITSVHQLLYDTDDMLWVGCYGQGIYCLNSDMKPVKHYTEPELPSRFITAMATDLSGNIWIGTDNNGLFMLNPKNGKVKKTSIEEARIQTLYRQNNNILWVGTTSDGLLQYDPRTDSSKAVTLDNTVILDIKSLTPCGNNELIMSSEKGLLKLDCINAVLRPFDNTKAYDNLPDNSIFAIALDNEGGLWLGTYFHGVCYCSPRVNSFSYYTVEKSNGGTSTNIIRKFTTASDGKIVLTSRNNGVSIFNPQTGEVKDLSLKRPSDNVQYVMPIDDKLWISDYDRGIVVVDYPSGRTVSTYSTANGLPSNVVNTLYRTSGNKIYAGTARGAAVFDGSAFCVIPEIKDASVMNILEDYEGNIWFATHFHGLFKRNVSGEFTNYICTPGDNTTIAGNNINCIFLDEHDILWVGTEGEGLDKFNPATGRVESHLSESRGLPSDIIYSIEEDKQGNMWVTTGRGLLKISPDSLHIHDYRYMEDLLNIHYFHNSSLNSRADNRMYIGGSGGFITFNPDDIVPNEVQPVVRISEFTVNGCPIHRTDGLVLESHEASFGCDVACLSYLSPSQNKIVYQLEGFDHEWKTLTGFDRHIDYMNLPWGEYTLRVKGANSDGIWSDPLALKIKVNRPLLLSNVMLVAYLLILLAASWLVKRRLDYLQRRKMVRFSHAKEKELYEAKIGFFTNIAHEIRTPLSLISVPLETILSSGDGNERTRHNLMVMQSNVHRLIELINQLLDFRKVEAQLMTLHFRSCDISEIVKNICARYEEFANLHLIKIDTKDVEPDIICNLDPEAFEKIVGNLMSNATKFANRHISVSLSLDRAAGMIDLKVSDDGPGIKEKDMPRIFESFYQVDDHGKHPGSGLGLPIALRLAEMHGGTLKVESEYGHGSAFVLRIPSMLGTGELDASEVAASAPLKNIEPAAHADGNASKRQTILVVEDNDQLRSFIAENLTDTYDVITASNGVEGLRQLEDKGADLLVSDIMMPVMDGIELCRAVRSNPAFENLPIVILSAKTDVETKVDGLNIGADAYIEKPFSIEHLEAQIHSIFDNRHRLHESFIKSPLDFYSRPHDKDTHETENAEFVRKLNQLILDNLTNTDFNIDQIAQTFCMSRSSFHSRVKSVTGETPNNYIRIVRLTKSAELLATGKYQIVEVCYMVGFNTPSYFSKCFADHFGKLPKDYINALK